MSQHRQQSLFILAIIMLAASARLIQWVPNFAPITALAVFSAYNLRSARLAYLMPVLAMIIGDVLLAVVRNDWGYAMHDTQLVVYGTLLASVALSRFVSRSGNSVASVGASTVLGSVLFFVVTNFAVWALGTMYTHDLSGLAQCYTMAVPFFRNSFIADLAYTTLMFGSLALAMRLSKRAPAVV